MVCVLLQHRSDTKGYFKQLPFDSQTSWAVATHSIAAD